jgi:hypothetical protein
MTKTISSISMVICRPSISENDPDPRDISLDRHEYAAPRQTLKNLQLTEARAIGYPYHLGSG